ncbi:MAG: hypothetical protein E6929_04065 [Clostridium sp.]|nr:hypothetical protein [Clostridium sp.]
MKNNNKKIFICIILTIIITAFAFLPFLLSYIERISLLGKVETSSVHNNISSKSDSITVENKLSLLCGYEMGKDSVIVVDTRQTQNGELRSMSIPDFVMDEISKLIRLEVIPSINIDEKLFLRDFSLKSLIDANDLGKQVKVWNMTLQGDEFQMILLIDAKTHMIYSYTLLFLDGYGDNIPENSPEKFAEYLGVKWDKEKGQYNGYSLYTINEKEITYVYSQSSDHIEFSLRGY